MATATTLNMFSSIPILVCLVFTPIVLGYLGINYGELGSDLPEAEEAVRLVQSIGATKVKMFNSNPKIIRAFANTGIELVVGMENSLLPDMAQDPEKALRWARSNVQAHLPSSKITCIVVGNEILAQQQQELLASSLVPAMRGVHGALVKLGLDSQVKVTTPHQLSVMATSYPPSAGAFRQELVVQMSQILSFHAQTGSPFFINVYPYLAYKAEPDAVPLDYVLFRPNNGSVDPLTNARYDDMLSAQVDAVYAAIGSLGFKDVPVCVSETGWPSRGDQDEPGATLDNASEYNGNVITKCLSGDRKGKQMSAFIFALFNENMKEGPTSERNYGLFKPDGTATYNLIKGAGNNPGGSGGQWSGGHKTSVVGVGVGVGVVLAFCIFLTILYMLE